jgi:O-antigen ligase
VQPLSLAAWAAAFFIGAALFAHTVALRLLMLACCAALAIAAIARDPAAIRALPPIWLAFALWGAWAVLSLAWSVEPERTVKELRNEIGYGALALWACHVAAQARNGVRIVAIVVTLAAIVLCTLAFYYFRQRDLPIDAGRHGGPGNLSSALLTLMACAISAAWYGYRSGRILVFRISLGVIALMLAAGYTTLNRTLWVGFAAQLLLIGALLAMRGTTPLSPRTKAVGFALAFAVIAGASVVMMRVHDTRQGTDPTAAFSKDWRLKLWPLMLGQVTERPLTGYGFGRGILREPLRHEFDRTLLWHAHNLFLDLVIQTGIVGLLLFLLLLAAKLREGWSMVRSADDLTVACGLAVVAVITGMVVRNMTDTLWVRQNALLYWGVLGVLFACSARPSTREGA